MPGYRRWCKCGWSQPLELALRLLNSRSWEGIDENEDPGFENVAYTSNLDIVGSRRGKYAIASAYCLANISFVVV